jgi:hypothetical protein
MGSRIETEVLRIYVEFEGSRPLSWYASAGVDGGPATAWWDDAAAAGQPVRLMELDVVLTDWTEQLRRRQQTRLL